MFKKSITILATASILTIGLIGCDSGGGKESVGKSQLQIDSIKSRNEALKEKSSTSRPGIDSYGK